MPVSTGPTPDFNQIELRWAGVNLDGTPCTGSIELTYNATVPLLDDDANLPISIYPVPISQPLTTATIQVKDETGALVNRTVGYARWVVPASDDPDITGFGGTYTVVEKLTGLSAGKGQTRNFVASKDVAGGIIWVNRITSVNPVGGQAISAVSVAQVNQMQAQLNQLIANGTGSGGSFSGVPNDGSVTNAKVASNAAISADKLADGSANKVMTSAERTRLAGMANGATANSTDALLLSRGNHTGTQLSTTISDFTEASEDAAGAMWIRSGGTYDDPNGIVGLTLAQMPAGATHTITLAVAKAAASRAAITSRTDIRIVVVGGTATTDWTNAATWLIDSWDKWELLP